MFGIPAQRGKEREREREGEGENESRDATAICTSYCPREE